MSVARFRGEGGTLPEILWCAWMTLMLSVEVEAQAGERLLWTAVRKASASHLRNRETICKNRMKRKTLDLNLEVCSMFLVQTSGPVMMGICTSENTMSTGAAIIASSPLLPFS